MPTPNFPTPSSARTAALTVRPGAGCQDPRRQCLPLTELSLPFQIFLLMASFSLSPFFNPEGSHGVWGLVVPL